MQKPVSLAEWLRLLESRHPKAIDLGLERVSAVWERMGRPRPAGTLVTVAGTNGKGSTVAYIASMLQALGYRCGTYTSPHVFRYNERVQIQSEPVTDQALTEAFSRVEAACGEISLTYFEFGTLAAFDLMSRAGLEFAVLEVGLGGRLDAVNILDADCAVITPIGLDHQEYLGDDREQIGFEKAGILRPGMPLVCTEAEPPGSVLQAAARLNCPVWRLGHEIRVIIGAEGLTWCLENRCIELPRPPMPGPHQVNNLAAAVGVVARLLPQSLQQADVLAAGISRVQLPGRLQASALKPRVWLDVGHNAHAAQAVAQAFKSMNSAPRYCVLAMLRDKDAQAVAAELDSLVDTWCCAGLEGDRGRSGEELARTISRVVAPRKVLTFPEVAAALEYALQETEKDTIGAQWSGNRAEPRILVFGSFVTVGLAEAFLSDIRD